jgi:hypothetical protein
MTKLPTLKTKGTNRTELFPLRGELKGISTLDESIRSPSRPWQP